MKVSTVAGTILLAFASSAVAQTKICIGGELDRLSPAQMASCRTKATELRSAVQAAGTPANWHYVLICDERGWSDYASLSGGDTASLMKMAENTDPRLRMTFLRGSRMETGNTRSLALLLASVKRDMTQAQRTAALTGAHTPASRPVDNVAQLHTPALPRL